MAAVVLVVIVVAAAFALSGGAGFGSPQIVPMSGYVTTGYGTHPTSDIFRSDTGSSYTGTVNVTNQDSESYSAQLSNG